MKRRVVVLVSTYPQISETYIKNEVDALAADYDLEIIASQSGSYPYRTRRPHIVLTAENQRNVLEYLQAFRPDALHGHYLLQIPHLLRLAERLRAPFTIRAHSFDVLGAPTDTPVAANTPSILPALREAARSEWFRGVLCFPFMRDRLIAAGTPPAKVIACNPVIDVHRFRDTSPNGAAIMNVGAVIPKKNMQDFIRLSRLVPEKTFNLYALGYLSRELVAANESGGGRVTVVPPVDPEDMPAEYKRHEWLVYTASKEHNTVGWPMALIEAMAAGVGVCMQAIRADLRTYIGDAGYLFDRPENLLERLRHAPTPAERSRAFEWAEQYDYRKELPLLTALWE